MDFNDYRLFVMPEVLPPGPPLVMQLNSSESSSLDFDLNLTEDDPSGFHDFEREWSHVKLNRSGDIDIDDLSPAQTPHEDDERMARSLDWGVGNVETHAENYSYPSDRRSRTLEDSPRRAISSPDSGVQQDSPSGSDSEKIKYKLMSAWNNMKFGMKPKTTFKNDSPIWYLGICYHCTRSEQEEQRQNGAHNTAVENFKKDFISRIWFTYRKDFQKLEGSHLSSDVGWGCMLRSGQMLLAQGLVMHFLGRDWRWYSHQKKYDTVFHHQIIKYFGDFPSEECPFSIHKLVQIGASSGKKPGDWYGPASVAFVLREAVEQAPAVNALLHQVALYVAQDGTVYLQDVIDLCTRPSKQREHDSTSRSSSHSDGGISSTEEPWRAVVILIPVRLGGEILNPIYIPCVRSILAHDNCIGIIGGRPKHSLYFVGWQDDKLIHLDPHLCQDTIDVRDRNFPLQTFHCMSPRKMAFTKMDPSCTLGFYCKTKADFYKFVREAELMSSPPKEKGLYPMFVFQSGRSADLMANQETPVTEERYLRVRRIDRKGRLKGTPKESDDFVFL